MVHVELLIGFLLFDEGMGGVGKTLLTASAVRDEKVRAAFSRILWVSLSQVSVLVVQVFVDAAFVPDSNRKY